MRLRISIAPMPKAMALALSFFSLSTVRDKSSTTGKVRRRMGASKRGQSRYQPHRAARTMAMRAFNTTLMRSGTLSENLGIDASDYDRIQITLKNPTSSGNPNARLFVYPPESNAFMCHWNVPVDTAMAEFQTYTLDLTTSPNSGSGTFEGEVARFGWRGPWGVANGDTIYWKSMVVYSS